MVVLDGRLERDRAAPLTPETSGVTGKRDALWQRHRIIDRLGNGYIGRSQFDDLVDELEQALAALPKDSHD